jgi:hypothetical protein
VTHRKKHETKGEMIRVLVTAKQKKAMLAAAEGAELSLSAWARTTLASALEQTQ